MLAATDCSRAPVKQDGFKPGVAPGITEAKVLSILGKPEQRQQFSLQGGINALVLGYPFGQVLLQNGRAIVVTIASDPDYVGPFNIKLGMQEEAVRKAFAAHPRHRAGHKDSYDLVAGTIDTRTRDIYDETDGLMIELAAANPNDPEVPFNVISISLTSAAGMSLMSSITKAKVGGLYPDQHVDNFVSEPWPGR